MPKQPWLKFWVDAWLSDEAVRSLSDAAKATWIDALCLMHKSARRGYLELNGKRPTKGQLAKMLHRPINETEAIVAEWLDSGTASQTDEGVIFCRRMADEERKRRACSRAGKRGGGNPRLRRTYKGRTYKGKPKGVLRDLSDTDMSDDCSCPDTTGDSSLESRNHGALPIKVDPKVPPKDKKIEDRSVPLASAKGTSAADKPQRPRDLLWDALVQGLGLKPTTDDERKRLGKIVSGLRAKEATVDGIANTITRGRIEWDGRIFGPEAVLKWYDQFHDQPRAPVRSQRDRAARVEAPPGKYKRFSKVSPARDASGIPDDGPPDAGSDAEVF